MKAARRVSDCLPEPPTPTRSAEPRGASAAAAWGGRRGARGRPGPAGPVTGTTRLLDEAAAKDLLADLGVPVPGRALVPVDGAAVAAEGIGFPVVVKATGLVHKTEAGGCLLYTSPSPRD